MANFTPADIERMRALREELAALEAREAAAGEAALDQEDSDLAHAMKYAEDQARASQQDQDLARRAAEGDAMANAILRDEVPSPREFDPEDMPPMRMDGMGAGPMPLE